MGKYDVIKCIDFCEKEELRLKNEKASLMKFNIKTDKIYESIDMYRKAYNEFSKKLLNSNYEIRINILAFILENYLDFYEYTEGVGIKTEMDFLLNW